VLKVFELLGNLNLPGFSRLNWKSNVRKHVCVHEKYGDMTPWRGAETADIVYDDVGGRLTEILRHKGYLPIFGPGWDAARPRYYIEVKTTTEDCNTRFFMSKSQHQRVSCPVVRLRVLVKGLHSWPVRHCQMHDLALHGVDPAAQIYLIARVYNLGQDNMSLRVYNDPTELTFTADSYTVKQSTSQVSF
jgi:hypothetical protein